MVTWIKFMLRAHANMHHRSKFSRTLVVAPGICESLDYINADVGLMNTPGM